MANDCFQPGMLPPLVHLPLPCSRAPVQALWCGHCSKQPPSRIKTQPWTTTTCVSVSKGFGCPRCTRLSYPHLTGSGPRVGGQWPGPQGIFQVFKTQKRVTLHATLVLSEISVVRNLSFRTEAEILRNSVVALIPLQRR